MAFQSPPSSISPGLTFGGYPAAAAGRHSNFYQPPKTPASTSTTPSFASATDYFFSSSKKRSRPASSGGSRSGAPISAWTQCATPSDGSYSSAYGRSSVLVNERYSLAGGLDTPGLQATAEMEQMQLGSSTQERRWRGESNGFARLAARATSDPLARERNGVPRMQSSPNGEPKRSWAGMAFSLVGKVFNLGSSVFRGFYAGGGKGYEVKPSDDMWMSRERCSTPLPGSWLEDDFFGDSAKEDDETLSRPPNKRRQTDKEAWVMVGARETEASPKRKVSGTTAQKATTNTYNSPHSRPTASRASNRRSLAPLPPSRRHSSMHVTHSGSPAQLQVPLSPERRASFAPMRSNSRPSSSSNHDQSYVSPEAERFVRRRARHDRQADAAMSDMSKKLADLIRQGQAALGTKFSVEGDDDDDDGGDVGMDEGFVDEEW